MAVRSRPGFKTNVEATVRGTAKRSVYLDLKPGQTLRLRFTPSSNQDGSVFFESSQHFKFTLDGEKRAYACLRYHGTEETGTECPICDYLEVAQDQFGASGEAMADKHGASNRWHGQVVNIVEGQEPVQTFIIGLSKTTAGKISKILKMEQDNRQPLLTDPEEGQIIQIERTGSGFNTRYEVMGTNVRLNLDEYFPDWDKSFLNVEKALKLRIEKPEVLLESMRETIGEAIFDVLDKAVKGEE